MPLVPQTTTTFALGGFPVVTPVNPMISASGARISGIGTMAGMSAPSTAMELFNGVMVSSNQVRQAKRLYIGNVPIGCDQVSGRDRSITGREVNSYVDCISHVCASYSIPSWSFSIAR